MAIRNFSSHLLPFLFEVPKAVIRQDRCEEISYQAELETNTHTIHISAHEMLKLFMVCPSQFVPTQSFGCQARSLSSKCYKMYVQIKESWSNPQQPDTYNGVFQGEEGWKRQQLESNPQVCAICVEPIILKATGIGTLAFDDHLITNLALDGGACDLSTVQTGMAGWLPGQLEAG